MKKFTSVLLALLFVVTVAQAQYTKRVTASERTTPSGQMVKMPAMPVNYTVNNIDQGFEDFTDFTLNMSPWTTVDVDGSPTYGITDVDFLNSGSPMAYIVFNPSMTTPPMDDPDIQAHTGNKYAACFASTAPPNNDWLITPLTPLGTNSSLTFWVKSYTAQYGLERYKVGVSTTDTDPASFTIISGASYLEAPADAWTEVTFDLNEYNGQNVYIGIQCVSNDAFIFMVDDVVVNTEGGVLYVYHDDFEGYNDGDYLALSNPDFWTTWSNAPGTTEDAHIVTEQANSPVNAVKDQGVTDLVLKLGNKTTGKYQVNFNYYVPSNFGGYYNFQHFESPGVEWAFEVYFAVTGDGYMHAGGENAATFTYPKDTWIHIENIIDLDNDWAEVYIDGALIYEWQYSLQAQGDPGTKQLGGVNLYAGAPTGETPTYYFDDVEYIILVQGTTEPKIEIGTSPIIATIEEGTTTTRNRDMSNVGEGTLEYNVIVTYDEPTAPLASVKTPALSSGRGNEQAQLDPNAVPSATNPSDRDVTLNYDGDNNSAIGLTNANQWRVAARFPASMVEQYNGMMLSQVEVFINEPADAHKLQVYGMGSPNVPGAGALLYEQDFTPIPASWNTITLNTPVYIDGSDIWVGYWMDQPAGIFPAGVDAGPHVADGDWISTGPGWSHLSGNPTLDFNWNIRAKLTGTAGPVWLSTTPTEGALEGGELISLEIGIDATMLMPLTVYKGKLHVRSNDLTNEEVNINVLVTVLVGINELGEKTYVVSYPNPATSMINLRGNTTIQQVTVSNNIGQVVYNNTFNTKEASISTNGFDAGVYFVKIETANGVTTHKVMVQ